MIPRILLIEDDRWLADSYRDVLDEYDIDTAINGQDAIDLIDSNDYDLVIADVMLDHGLVIDLLHELQAYDDTALLPIVLCTTLAQRIQLEDVQSYGVVAVLDKTTLTPKLLREAVEHNIANGI
ncbi:response regulator [Candidatus Saccharibacteria bacterium]|nr:response regulator [Candidatus Saccharibacteria bacterium]